MNYMEKLVAQSEDSIYDLGLLTTTEQETVKKIINILPNLRNLNDRDIRIIESLSKKGY